MDLCVSNDFIWNPSVELEGFLLMRNPCIAGGLDLGGRVFALPLSRIRLLAAKSGKDDLNSLWQVDSTLEAGSSLSDTEAFWRHKMGAPYTLHPEPYTLNPTP